MNAEQYRGYQALLRRDFEMFAIRCFLQLNPGVRFAPGWHIELVAAWMALLREQNEHMIINLPPVSGRARANVSTASNNSSV